MSDVKGLGVPGAEPPVGPSAVSPRGAEDAATVPHAELLRMDRILAWLGNTSDSQWCVDWCGEEASGVPGGVRFCVRGHLLVYAEFHGCPEGFDALFHEVWATEYMYYPVNDGKHPDYQQATPKARVMAYFGDLRDGKKPTTYQLMDAEMKSYRVSDQKGREAGPKDGTPGERDGEAGTPNTSQP